MPECGIHVSVMRNAKSEILNTDMELGNINLEEKGDRRKFQVNLVDQEKWKERLIVNKQVLKIKLYTVAE